MATQEVRNILSRDFILASFVQFALAFLFSILLPTLPIYLSQLGSREVEIGVLMGGLAVSSLILRPLVGRALLRIPEQVFMTAGALVYILTSVAYLFAPPFWPFLIVRVFHGVGVAFASTALFTLIANISPEAHRGQSLSYFFLTFNFAGAVAPPLGMFLINHFGFTVLFLVCSGLSLGALFLTRLLRKRHVPAFQYSSAEDGFWLSRKALAPSVINFFFYFTWGALSAFFPLYAINHGVDNPGFFFTTVAIMLILGRTLGGRILDLYSRERIILPCLFAYVISMVILAFSKSLPMFILIAVIWGIGHAFFFPSLVAYVLDRVGSSPGPAMGTFTAVMDLGWTLGPVAMGVILHVASYQIMFLCLALMGVINLNYFYFFVRKRGHSIACAHSSP
ncbi:MAG TPA: MFS transporter [Thermodesulfobacteriota bacterium]|nr:MFS transporter [Thermodesulfobacteriota bacterium]